MSTFFEDNITVLNPYVKKNFWDKLPMDIDPDEGWALYEKFLETNKQVVNESNQALLNGNFSLLTEKYDVNVDEFVSDYGEMITEAFKIPGKQNDPSSTITSKQPNDEDEFEDDETQQTEVDDEVESEYEDEGEDELSEVMPVYNYDIEHDAVRAAAEGGHLVSWYPNRDHDIHKVVNNLYIDLVKKNENLRTFSRLSALDTIKCKQMDALFAFMDIPNMSLKKRGSNVWHTINVENMEGIFYSSTFYNDSIGNWDVSNVKDLPGRKDGGFVNAFTKTEWTNEDAEKWLSAWEPQYGDVTPPIFGAKSNTEQETQRHLNVIKTYCDDDTVQDEIEKYEKRRAEKEAKKAAKAARIKLRSMGKTNESNNYEQYISNNMNNKYVMNSDEFINENFFVDAIRKVGGKLKDTISTIGVALKNGFVIVLDQFGKMFNVVIPQASVDYANQNVAGVSASMNGNVSIDKEEGMYDLIKKGSPEYQNYLYFLKNVGNGSNVNEARIPLSDIMETEPDRNGKSLNMRNCGYEDITTEYFKTLLNSAIANLSNTRKVKPLLIWGAPGIGKTTIPKAIVTELNKGKTDPKDKMALIVAQVGDMQSDGFSLPMLAAPKDLTSTDWGKILKDAYEIDDVEAENYKIMYSDDAPKTWLPMYKPTGNQRTDTILNALANGSVGRIYNNRGKVIGFETTGNGGIILFDELLRAKRDILTTVCQIIDTREYKGFVLGDKWAMVCCSNRPYDDDEVKKVYSEKGQYFFRRFTGYNLVPSFPDWCKWAMNNGFDETTLEWIGAKDVDGPNSRWHYMDTALHSAEHQPRMACPASWFDAMNNLHIAAEDAQLSSIRELSKERFELIVQGELPSEIAKDYTDYYYEHTNATGENLYDLVIAHPGEDIRKLYKKINKSNVEPIKGSEAIDKLLNTIRIRYDVNNKISPDEFFACLLSLGKTYPQIVSEIWNNFYVKVYNICELDTITKYYDDKFGNAEENPYYKVDNYFEDYFPYFKA